MRFLFPLILLFGVTGHAATRLVLPWVSYSSQYRSTLVLHNGGKQTALVSITGRKPNTDVARWEDVPPLDGGQWSLPPYGTLSLEIDEAFAGLQPGIGFTVLMESESDFVAASLVTVHMATGAPAIQKAVEPAVAEAGATMGLKLDFLPGREKGIANLILVNTGPDVSTASLFLQDSEGKHIATHESPPLIPFHPVIPVFPELATGSPPFSLVAVSDLPLAGTLFVFGPGGQPAMMEAEDARTPCDLVPELAAPDLSEVSDSGLDSVTVNALRANAGYHVFANILEQLGPVCGAQSAELPAALVESVYRAFAAFANAPETLPDGFTAASEPFPRYDLSRLSLYVSRSESWPETLAGGADRTGVAEIDDLLDRFGLFPENVVFTQFYLIVDLETKDLWNMAGVAKLFEAIPGIENAEVASNGGDGDDVVVSFDANGISVTFFRKWGDCFAGCIHQHFWRYRVDAGGEIAFLGEGGDPLE